jgi:putative ABC transport system permease protein
MLFLAVAVVLLIACANLAGLLLVRAIRRQREIAVRMAMGAPALAVLRQMILESLVISVAGGLVGIGLAALAVGLGRDLLPETLPRVDAITLNWSVVGFALLLAVMTGFFCGLAPGFAALRTNVNASLKEGGRSGSAGGGHARLRSTLVVLEIAVALVLLTASGLLLRSFSKMSAVDLGFRPDHVTTAIYSLPQKQYAAQAQVDTFNRRLLERLRQLPGVQAAGLTSTIPATGDGIEIFVVEGYVDPRGPDRSTASPSEVMPDYFQAMGIPLLRGRYFTEADDANSQLAVIVNHEFAQHYWPGQDPIGKRITFDDDKRNPPTWMTIVGVSANAKQSDWAAEPYPEVYLAALQNHGFLGETGSHISYITLVARTAGDPAELAAAVKNVVGSFDRNLPVSEVFTMDRVVAEANAQPRFEMLLLGIFAAVALLLAAVGIYGVMNYSVSRRTREIGIRVSLGASRADVLRMVLGQGMIQAAAGAAVGVAGALLLSRFIAKMLYGVPPTDSVTFSGVAVVLGAAALLASGVAARKAIRIEPMVALRSE